MTRYTYKLDSSSLTSETVVVRTNTGWYVSRTVFCFRTGSGPALTSMFVPDPAGSGSKVSPDDFRGEGER